MHLFSELFSLWYYSSFSNTKNLSDISDEKCRSGYVYKNITSNEIWDDFYIKLTLKNLISNAKR